MFPRGLQCEHWHRLVVAGQAWGLPLAGHFLKQRYRLGSARSDAGIEGPSQVSDKQEAGKAAQRDHQAIINANRLW